MARTPTQGNANALERDRKDCFRMLTRARQDTRRPKEKNKKLIEALKSAQQIYTEDEHY